MKRLAFCALLLLMPIIGAAQEKKPADDKPPFRPLWPDGAPGAQGKTDKDIPAVQVYAATKANGAAVVVCPGGGYGGLAMDHEGHQVAKWLNAHGMTALVLRYRLGPKYHHPIQLGDAQRAIRWTRANAKELGVDPGRVGILGFSAGGHLASTAGTHFDKGQPDAKDSADRPSCRPDFLILGYPVITLQGPYAHGGSRTNLLGKDADPKLIEHLSNDLQVTPETPPTFLVHTTEDKGVPPQNSVLFYLALVKNKVPAELHIYEKGRHGLGLGLGGGDPAFSSWPDRCVAWLKTRGLLEPK